MADVPKINILVLFEHELRRAGRSLRAAGDTTLAIDEAARWELVLDALGDCAEALMHLMDPASENAVLTLARIPAELHEHFRSRLTPLDRENFRPPFSDGVEHAASDEQRPAIINESDLED